MATRTLQLGYGGKVQYEVFASAARAVAQAYTSDDFVVPYGKTLTVIIDITAGASTPAVTPTIVGVTNAGPTYTVLTGAQITSTSAAKVLLRVGAGVAEVTNLGTGIPLPEKFRIVMTHGDADSLTYSVNLQVS